MAGGWNLEVGVIFLVLKMPEKHQKPTVHHHFLIMLATHIQT
jgi:hypothetical protein